MLFTGVCFRILSLTCSPSGTSFVCSAAAPLSRAGGASSGTDAGSRTAQPVSGKLLLWDTKTVKQQVTAAVILESRYAILFNAMVCYDILTTQRFSKRLNGSDDIFCFLLCDL